MMVPSEERLKPIEHFSPEITNAVKLHGLEGRVHLQKKQIGKKKYAKHYH